MYYARRKRLKELAEREAAGGSFWTADLDNEARTKMLYAAQAAVDKVVFDAANLDEMTRMHVLRDNGWPYLAGKVDPQTDIANAILTESIDVVFSYVEALVRNVGVAAGQTFADVEYQNREAYEGHLPILISTIKTILREHRVSFDFVDGKFVPLESLELHEKVVVPALTLLGGDPDYAEIETAYAASLDEIHNGTPDDAITDAGTALQATLESLGCDGNALGPLIKVREEEGPDRRTR